MAQRFVLAFCGLVACVAGTDVTASRWVCATFVFQCVVQLRSVWGWCFRLADFLLAVSSIHPGRSSTDKETIQGVWVEWV